jgi:hypothetical protein
LIWKNVGGMMEVGGFTVDIEDFIGSGVATRNS